MGMTSGMKEEGERLMRPQEEKKCAMYRAYPIPGWPTGVLCMSLVLTLDTVHGSLQHLLYLSPTHTS